MSSDDAAAPAALRSRPAAAASSRMHPRWLLAAPHRVAFLAGAFVLGGSGVWWAVVMIARALGVAVPWAVPSPLAHGLLMGYGFVPLFFVGFLFTAGPKWLGRPGVEARAIAAPVAAIAAGWTLYAVGVHTSAALAAAGVGAAGVGFGTLAWAFGRIVRASQARDQVHARIVLAGCTVVTAVLAGAAAALAAGAPHVLRAALHFGLWGGIALVYVSVVHRMVPFFSAAAVPALDAWRPMWLVWTLVTALAVQAPLAAAEVLWWPLPAGLRAAQAGVETLYAALLLWLAVRWGLVQSLKIRLLAMLHVGFVWLGLAFLLGAVSHALQALGDAGLGLAPLHALTAGFFGSTLFAMVTRVSAGHGGRPLAADTVVWRLFWLLQVAIAARVVGALAAADMLLPLAALAWAAAVGAWALRYGRWYLTPRADGRPG